MAEARRREGGVALAPPAGAGSRGMEDVRVALESPRGRQLFEICVRARRRMLVEEEGRDD